jgi:plastocyanin
MKVGVDVKRTAMGLAVMLALLGAACSSDSPTTAASSPSSSPAPVATSPPASPSASPAGSPAANTLQLGAGGALLFAPADFSVKENTQITLDNVGTVPHTFTVVGKNIDVVVSNGQSLTQKIDLSPGTYQFICRFHVSLGMKGTLTVTG